MVKLVFMKVDELVKCVLRPRFSNAMSRCARQRLEYFESSFSEKFAFSGTETSLKNARKTLVLH